MVVEVVDELVVVEMRFYSWISGVLVGRLAVMELQPPVVEEMEPADHMMVAAAALRFPAEGVADVCPPAAQAAASRKM